MQIAFYIIIYLFLPSVFSFGFGDIFKGPDINKCLAKTEALMKSVAKEYYTNNFEKAKKQCEEAFEEVEMCHDEHKGRQEIKDEMLRVQEKKTEIQQLLDSEADRRIQINVNNMIKPHVEWDTVKGMENEKDILRNAVSATLHKDVFQARGVEPLKNFLLYGPPGTGKTTVAKAMASAEGFTFIEVPPSAFKQKWQGEGEKVVERVFKTAIERAPCVVFFDEVDSIISQRQDSEQEHVRAVKNTFLPGLDSVLGKDVYIVAATNRPDDLDDAFKRRFPQQGRILIGPADAEYFLAGSGYANSVDSLLKARIQTVSPDIDYARLTRLMRKKFHDLSWPAYMEEYLVMEKTADYQKASPEEKDKAKRKLLENSRSFYSNKDITDIRDLASRMSMEKFQSTKKWRQEDDKWEPCTGKDEQGCVEKKFYEFKKDQIIVPNWVGKVEEKHYETAIKMVNPSIKGTDFYRHKNLAKTFGRQELPFLN